MQRIYWKRGEITVFLSLIFVLFISFIAAMLESTVLQTAKNQKRLDTDRAVYSAFGEYEKQLLEKYELLAIDGSYGSGTFREENILDHMHYYGTVGIDHHIQGIQYLSDRKGTAFKEQVLAYMEDTYGIAVVRELAGMSGIWEEQELQGEEAQQEDMEVNTELQKILEEGEGILPEEDNPLPHVEELKSRGLLSLVLPDEYEVSGRRVAAGEQPSMRNLRTGRGSFYFRQGLNGLEEKLLFREYLLKKFGNAIETRGEDQSLSYEIEYMLGGKEDDYGNLEAVAGKLLAIRFGINYLYLLTDSVRKAEAEALALTLSTLAALPGAAEIVKQALLAAWAFGESIVDVRALMAGKRTVLVKDSASWQLSLSSLLTLGTGGDIQDGMDAEGGVSYKDYLRILLFLQDEDTLTMRALDRVEQNMKMESGRSAFAVDNCIVKVRVQSEALIRDGLTYSFPTYFGYEF